MRKIDVIFRHNDVTEDAVKNKHAVVIDVLRATSVITTALNCGAASVRAVAEIQQAFAIKSKETDVILAGERDAEIIDGFQFGNSPLAMTPDHISDKHLVICTSNGSKAIAAVQSAQKISIAALINAEAVSQYLLKDNLDIVLVCSGTLGKFSLDDAWAAGLLIQKLTKKEQFFLSDAAQMTALAVSTNKNPIDALADCYHLNVLLSKGYSEDIQYCTKLDIIDAVPKWNGDRFQL